MKKIWLMLLVICSVCAFSACSDDDKKEEEKVCPVTNIVVPETAETGETITITGEGFDATAKFVLQNEAEEKVDMETTFINDKEVSCIIPAVEAGTYKVILSQDGEWDVEKTIEISVPERKPRVKQITANFLGDANVFKFTYDEQNRVSNITHITNEMSDYAHSYDFTYEENRINVSATYNNPDGADKGNFSFSLSEERIIATLDEDGDESMWEYNDESNYLSFGGYEECEFTWENNNLTRLYSKYGGGVGTAVYGDSKSNNGPIDIVPIMYNYFGYVLENDMHDILAYMLDICGNHSANLPTEMTNDEGDLQTIAYTMDEEHPEYISEAKISFTNSWDEPTTYSIKIIYE